MRRGDPTALLGRLAAEYRATEQEHRRQPPGGATRHRLEDDLDDLAARFERVLEAWVRDDALRARWRAHLAGAGPAPDAPPRPSPPLFRGRTVAGARFEIQPVADGYDILLDGARIDHGEVPWHLEPDLGVGPIRIGAQTCVERFDAPAAALAALDEFVAGRGPAPWAWAPELLADGLIDPELGLTARGRRCLRQRRPPRAPAPGRRNHCVVVADAARARVLALEVDRSRLGGQVTELVELAALANPALRARDVDVVADSGTGRRGGAHTPLHAPPDHRDQRRREHARQFATQVAEAAAAVWRTYPSCELVVAASPVMLGLLRPALERQVRPKDELALHELARNLTRLSDAALHDLLAEAELLPPRGRRAPLVPAPGLPA